MKKEYDIYVSKQKFRASKEESPDALRDTSALSFCWRPGQERQSILIEDCIIDGRGASEGLKLSFCSNVYVKKCAIFGGYEDCVDIVRGTNIVFSQCTFISAQSKQHITAKGGAKGLTFRKCLFLQPYRKWYDGACIDLGNWTDYDDVVRPGVRDVLIDNCTMFDAGPVLVRVLHGDSPSVSNSRGWVIKVPPLFTKLFFHLQRKGKLGKRRRFAPDDLKIYPHEL